MVVSMRVFSAQMSLLRQITSRISIHQRQITHGLTMGSQLKIVELAYYNDNFSPSCATTHTHKLHGYTYFPLPKSTMKYYPSSHPYSRDMSDHPPTHNNPQPTTIALQTFTFPNIIARSLRRISHTRPSNTSHTLYLTSANLRNIKPRLLCQGKLSIKMVHQLKDMLLPPPPPYISLHDMLWG